MIDLILAQTAPPVPSDSDAGSLLIYFIGACALMVGGAFTALLTGKVVLPSTVAVIRESLDYHRNRADRLESALSEANTSNRELSKLQAESQARQAETQKALAESLNRFGTVLDNQRKTSVP